ncbi:dual specificity protein kinase yak1 [Orbilia oligospora]|nr:dual specificity protein kinase yak1 [Orbilia oligospora]KAF3160928.1 dual specificity protein kinase yak1 [Orbilia oligospora]KAF3275510.1 dual specificity protein kinase yak1 [Orbilia oligospora]
MASTPSGLLGNPHFQQHQHQHQHQHHQQPQQQQQPPCNSPAQKQQFAAPVQSYALPPQAALSTASSSQYVASPLQHGAHSTLPPPTIAPLSHTSSQIPQPNIDSDSRPLPHTMMHIPGTQAPRPGGASATSSSYPLPKTEIVHSFVRTTQSKDIVGHTNAQPAYRRAHPEGGFISPVQALTCYLPATYRICNPNFKYESSRNPRRVLTKPSKGVKNDGYDNEDSDYILYVNDILGSEEAGHKNRYLILDVLGQGTFGQVVKCQNLRTQEVVAVKVVKNRTAYFNQSMMEVSVLDLLNSKLDKNDEHHILRLKDTFIHRQHLCLVFELLSVNLYELIKQNQFRGLESPIIKVIDFGSACDERQTVYTYIQSRFYRSPEVLLLLPYSSAIDMWSLGCIVVELFLGLPLFPGSSEYNQVARIVEMLGLPPTWMLEMGKQSGEFFEKVTDEFGRKTYRLKSMETYSREHGTKEQPSKRYFQATTLPDIINQYAMPRKNMKPAEIEREMNNRVAFIDFVRGLLNINPLERWSPQQAKLHPFITQQKFTGPFVPPMNLKSSPSGGLPKSPHPPMASNTSQSSNPQTISSQHISSNPDQVLKNKSNTSGIPQQITANYQNPSAGGYTNPASHPAQTQPPTYSGPNYGTNGGQQFQQQVVNPPPPYNTNHAGYNASPTAQHQSSQQSIGGGYHAQQQPPSLYQTATTRAGRQRASTIGQNDSGIPPQLSRHAMLLDPNQPIRLQPSPAYYPPPSDGEAASGIKSRRRSQAGQGGQRSQRDFIRTLEDRTLEDGLFNNQTQWQ